MNYILMTNQLTKIVNGKKIISDVSIRVRKGEIYGFLGPNGAGKTTLMKLLLNLWKSSYGTIELFGKEVKPPSYRYLGKIGSIVEFPTFWENLSGRDNLKLHCEYMKYEKQDNIDAILELVGLKEAADMVVKNYSLGMKQRLGIARAIVHQPELLILDEPTNGLDPAGMKEFRDLLRKLATECGMTIIISTHILSEIESIVDTVGLIKKGEMIQEISMSEIKGDNANYLELVVNDVNKAIVILTNNLTITNIKVINNQTIYIYDNDISSQNINKELALNDIEVSSLSQKTVSLEEYFLKMTKEEN